MKNSLISLSKNLIKDIQELRQLIINYKIIQLKLHEDKYIIELNQIDEKLKENGYADLTSNKGDGKKDDLFNFNFTPVKEVSK